MRLVALIKKSLKRDVSNEIVEHDDQFCEQGVESELSTVMEPWVSKKAETALDPISAIFFNMKTPGC